MHLSFTTLKQNNKSESAKKTAKTALLNLHFENGKLLSVGIYAIAFCLYTFYLYFNFVELGEIFRNLKVCAVCVLNIFSSGRNEAKKILTPIVIPNAYVMHNGI